MQRSSLLLVLALAMLVAHLGGCGGSSSNAPTPSLVDTKVSELTKVTTLNVTYGPNDASVRLQIVDSVNDDDQVTACPSTHATATMNGQPMTLEPASVKAVTTPEQQTSNPGGSPDGAFSCGSSGTEPAITTYECQAPIFHFSGDLTAPMKIEITDESGSMTVIADDLALNPTMTLDRAVLSTNETISVIVDPPLSPSVSGEPPDVSSDEFDGFDPTDTITPTGFSFVVPALVPATEPADDSGASDAAVTDEDGGAAIPVCEQSPPGPCSGVIQIAAQTSWSSAISQCSGVLGCSVAREDVAFSFNVTFEVK